MNVTTPDDDDDNTRVLIQIDYQSVYRAIEGQIETKTEHHTRAPYILLPRFLSLRVSLTTAYTLTRSLTCGGCACEYAVECLLKSLHY